MVVASSRSPLASCRAALHSIMPAPVRVAELFDESCGDFSHTRIWVLRVEVYSVKRSAIAPRAPESVTRPRTSDFGLVEPAVVDAVAGAVRGTSASAGVRRLPLRPCRGRRAPRRRCRPRTAGSIAARRRCPESRSRLRPGSQLVSTTPITGILSLRASSTAICSCRVSTTKTASGSRPMPRMPSRFFASLRRSLSSRAISFFESVS